MPNANMHPDEVTTDIALVKRLIAAQLPQWSQLPVQPVLSSGTDNALYRLGHDMVVRLPRIASAARQLQKEQRWLPHLAPHLPLAVPLPLAQGQPADAIGYPYHWSVYRWLDGENATLDRLHHPAQAAQQLAHFIKALQAIDTTGAPPPGDHNFRRGVPLAQRDQQTRAIIATLDDVLDEPVDSAAALQVWQDAINAPVWSGAPVWIHGDLQAGNLLAHDGHLSAVIDFGGLAMGDPACDLQVAWNLFTKEARGVFRETMQVDEATWRRGRGWALSVGVIALPYYQHSNPSLAAISRRAIEAATTDFKRPLR